MLILLIPEKIASIAQPPDAPIEESFNPSSIDYGYRGGNR